MEASSQTNVLIERGERLAQQLRPATLLYAGAEIPCSPGNKTFFQRGRQNGAGFQSFENLFLKILRADLPLVPYGAGGQMRIEFKRGQACQVRNDDPDCPEPGETFDFIVGENNHLTSTVIMLNVESENA